MNFDLDEAQRVIAASAAEVLGAAEQPGPGAGPADGGWAGAWQALAKAGLLALTLPGRLGGDDLGVLEAAVLLTEVGRRAADVPALATIMLGTLPVTRWGSRELQDKLLAGVASGETILTAAVREPTSGMPATPATKAVLGAAGPGGITGTVTGVKIGVPYAAQARWILVPAALAGGGDAGGAGGGAAGGAGRGEAGGAGGGAGSGDVAGPGGGEAAEPGRQEAARAVVVVEAAGPGVALVRTPASGTAPEYTVRLEAAPISRRSRHRGGRLRLASRGRRRPVPARRGGRGRGG